MRNKCDNEKLKDALKGAKEIYETAPHGLNPDDEQLGRLTRFQSLTVLEKDMLLLYATKGVTETAKLYGCSRCYIYKLVTNIQNKIKGK